ncbi:MFS transporter [Listeria newyorkensis]|uniref:MFS transporter n=1 Tax=Listeria newyorkensis TaxID=1497681 RepID=A0ABX4XR07_9LIST|nr:MFS transporter [Listeria newyorkensis]KGL46098.1 MFS transporter [Listeria newyorkensis]PNP94485.1 MFS transporter [Listeria newyorkensis]SQC58766.1 Inner membrane protein ybjJ [Listeria newyorkensis]
MEKKWYYAILIIFTTCGFSFSSWISRTPELRDALHATTGTMGVILLGLSMGSILGLVLANFFVRARGGRFAIMTSAFFMFSGFIALSIGALVASQIVVFAALFIFGMGAGMCNVAMNLEGTEIEYRIKKTILPVLHAMFSIGTLAGAGVGAICIKLDISVSWHLTVVACLLFATLMISTRFVPAGIGKDSEADKMASIEEKTADRRLWLNKRTVALAIMALCLAFVEGSANDWIPLAMVDGYDVSHSFSTIIYGVFLTGMISGRSVSGRLIDTYGRVLLLRIAVVLAAIGLLLVILKISIVLCVIAIFLWGLGASLGFPMTISAAGDESEFAVRRVSLVTLAGYSASLAGPPLLGFLANHFGLLNAFIFVLIAICVAGLFTSNVAKVRQAS